MRDGCYERVEAEREGCCSCRRGQHCVRGLVKAVVEEWWWWWWYVDAEEEDDEGVSSSTMRMSVMYIDLHDRTRARSESESESKSSSTEYSEINVVDVSQRSSDATAHLLASTEGITRGEESSISPRKTQ